MDRAEAYTLYMTHSNGVVIFTMTGYFGIHAGEDLAAKVDLCWNQSEERFVLDLQQCPFISSQGISILLDLAANVQERKGALILCGVDSTKLGVFNLVGLTEIAQVLPSLEEAIQKAKA